MFSILLGNEKAFLPRRRLAWPRPAEMVGEEGGGFVIDDVISRDNPYHDVISRDVISRDVIINHPDNLFRDVDISKDFVGATTLSALEVKDE